MEDGQNGVRTQIAVKHVMKVPNQEVGRAPVRPRRVEDQSVMEMHQKQ